MSMEEGESGKDLDGYGGDQEDPVAVGEAVAWTRWRWRQRGVEAVAYTRRRWRWRGIEAHAEKERARSVNPATVGEAVGDSPAWTRR
jgi:hypothetical protein